jgi:WD40 repeat protein
MKICFKVILILVFSITVHAQFSLYLENNIPVKTQSISCIKISNDGRFLAFGEKSGVIYIWDLDVMKQLHQLTFHRDAITSLAFDLNNKYLVSGSLDKKIAVWNLYSGQVDKVLKDFKSQISNLKLSPDDRLLAASGKSKEIFLWEFPAGFLKGKLKGHKKDVVSLAFNINGNQILSVGEDKLMIVWDVEKQKLVRKTEIESKTLKNSGIDVKSANFSSDKYFVGVGIQEHVLAKGGRSMIFKYNLSLYEWNTGSEIITLEGNNKDLDLFAISPDKNYIATDNSTLRQNQLSFWNIQTGMVEKNYPMDGEVSVIDISENGQWLAVGVIEDKEYKKCSVMLWKLSGIDGYARFDTGQQIKSTVSSGFGSAIKLTTPSEPLIQFGERKKLAVLYFDSPGLSEDISKTASYLLEGKLGNSPFVELIERNQIEKVISELQYQMSGLTTSDAVDVGKHLNAEYILTGSVNKLGNLLIITSKLISVETSQIKGTREVQCNNATIENVADMIAILAPTIAKY